MRCKVGEKLWKELKQQGFEVADRLKLHKQKRIDVKEIEEAKINFNAILAEFLAHLKICRRCMKNARSFYPQ